jgi:tetratricopeptide (TPR) repeat protein
MRPDAEPLAAAGVIPMFKDVVKDNPDDIYAALAYYRALAKDGTGIDEAIKGLRDLVERHPKDLACIDGLLFALASVGDPDGMSQTLSSVSKELAAHPRLSRYRGWLAQNRRAFAEAVAEYKRALEIDPSNQEILHRLGESYKLGGNAKEAEATKAREAEVEAARKELRGIKGQEAEVSRVGLFEDASRRLNLGKNPDVELFKKLADVRWRMGHPEEALAWYLLVLQEAPTDTDAREAVERIRKGPAKPGSVGVSGGDTKGSPSTSSERPGNSAN